MKVQKALPGRYADENGLYLLVKPSGTRSWVLRIVLNGRRRDFGLGSVPSTRRHRGWMASPLDSARFCLCKKPEPKLAKGAFTPRRGWTRP
ncbi:MAG TPA: Arm DNA-binding domain-containing protein [Sphingomonadaceae bacterium]|nr:Arm DNA-binding domain-containing protein [Sphingomonadaceae bacterium]